MPMPVISQPIRIAPGDAPFDMSEGRLKTPPPIIEPTTRAVSGRSVSFDVDSVGTSRVASTVVIVPRYPPGVKRPPTLASTAPAGVFLRVLPV